MITTKEVPRCLGQLKNTCKGDCGHYQQCLEIHMGISVKLETRD